MPHAASAASLGHLPDAFLQTLDCLPVESDLRFVDGVGEGNPQELAAPGTINAAFLGVDLQPHPLGDKPRDTLHHSVACLLAPDIDTNVIGIADKAQTALFELVIEFVQHDI